MRTSLQRTALVACTALSALVLTAGATAAYQAAPAAPAPKTKKIPPPVQIPPLPIPPTPREDRLPTRPVGPVTPPLPPSPPRPSLITNPSWARQPTPEYPAAAIDGGITQGQAVLECVIQPNGALAGCSVMSETPAGYGFGASAVAGTERARLSPRTVDGAAQGARTRFTIRYRLPQEEAAPVPAPPAPAR